LRVTGRDSWTGLDVNPGKPQTHADRGARVNLPEDRQVLTWWVTAAGDAARRGYQPPETEADRAAPEAVPAATLPADNGAPPRGPVSQKALETLLVDSEPVLRVARDTNRTAEERALEICRLERRFLAWNAEQWGELLGVTSAAIRKTDFWTKDRPQLKEAGLVPPSK
jgi:hypothetical protein